MGPAFSDPVSSSSQLRSSRQRELLRGGNNNYYALSSPNQINWSPLYASMPVLRSTMIREPISWLLSKFFWHKFDDGDVVCDDVTAATQFTEGAFEFSLREQTYISPEIENHGGKDYGMNYFDSLEDRDDKVSTPNGDRVSAPHGWANRFAMQYILYLCGEDCAARWEMGAGDLDQIEAQAASNLRHSFAVVGLLNETETYYEMLSTRVTYLDTSRNQNVTGSNHKSGGRKEKRRCSSEYKDPSFRQKMIESSREVAALVRLYDIGVEVNRFQLEELRSCPAAAGRNL